MQESDLMCGSHTPSDRPTWEAMILRGEKPTPRRHNCSGKHTGMLAHAVMRGLPKADYVNPHHPVQKTILQAFAEMTGMEPAQVIWGQTAVRCRRLPSHSMNAALGFARLADPAALPERRANALGHIFQAMSAYPVMIAGPGGFDTLVMQAGAGTIVSKGGAEGYQCMAVAPGTLGLKSPGLGIAFKIADGDLRWAGASAGGALASQAAGCDQRVSGRTLGKFDRRSLHNFRKLEVGEIRPAFSI